MMTYYQCSSDIVTINGLMKITRGRSAPGITDTRSVMGTSGARNRVSTVPVSCVVPPYPDNAVINNINDIKAVMYLFFISL